MKQNTKKLTLRLSEKEYRHLKAQAEAAGLKLEPLLRQLVQNLDIKPRPPDVYGDLLWTLSAIEARLKVISSKTCISCRDLRDAISLARQAWEAVKETL